MNAELMAQIQGGKPLRKSITNDRSVVAAAGKVTGEETSTSAPAAADDEKGVGGTPMSFAQQLGALFGGGAPAPAPAPAPEPPPAPPSAAPARVSADSLLADDVADRE